MNDTLFLSGLLFFSLGYFIGYRPSKISKKWYLISRGCFFIAGFLFSMALTGNQPILHRFAISGGIGILFALFFQAMETSRRHIEKKYFRYLERMIKRKTLNSETKKNDLK